MHLRQTINITRTLSCASMHAYGNNVGFNACSVKAEQAVMPRRECLLRMSVTSITVQEEVGSDVVKDTDMKQRTRQDNLCAAIP